MLSPRRVGLPLLAALLLSACALGPRYESPRLPAPSQWHAELPHGGDPTLAAQWWSGFDDPLVAELVSAAENASPTLAQALARIEQSRAAAGIARAGELPSLSASAGKTRSGGDDLPNQSLRRGSLDALWELDLFGANRRAHEAASARFESAQYQLHDARVSIAAEVAQEYLSLRACEALVKSAQSDLASRRESERLTLMKVKVGFDAPADGALASASAADGAARLDAQRAECEIAVKALVALTGLDEQALRDKLAERTARLPMPAALDVASVPATALSQRPDIAALERDMAAASADIGAAEAARYPRITLSGSIGVQSLLVGGAKTEGQVWSFGPALDLPIFDAGRRAANADAARARYDEAVAGYKGRIVQAVREVEQNLVRLQAATLRENNVVIAAEGYEQSFRAANDRWRVGVGSLLDLEAARRTAVGARDQVLAVRRERVAAWIGLYRALGGGWQTAATATAAN